MMVKHEWKVLTRGMLADAEAQKDWLESARESGAVALIDKHENWTSFDCVAKLRNLTRIKRVGHAGTLDPLATGLLVVCFGKATKGVASFQDANKTYDVVVKLGAGTQSDDRAGEETTRGEGEEEVRDGEQITEALKSFLGTQIQVPPRFSAIRHGRRRQYDMARAGVEFADRPRVVDIESIDSIHISWPFVSFTLTCSTGTYVRSVARDLGDKLGCGGYVWSLRRTRSGDFYVDDAVCVEDVVLFVERTAA
ncbi:MAG: tRNA pseudouridine(55) synthase TruB [Ignavibacteria bacterium]|nr:tRNA pseudouridine(55) synthase TruB [Ignavibacteria bacterium]